jgi:carbonic anhydrase
VVVLGHSHCGAVTAAVEAFLRPHSYLKLADNMPLRTIVDSLLVSVRAASLALERAYGPSVARQPGYRTALVETSVVVNAAWAAYSLAHELGGSPLQVVYGRYDIANGRLGVPLRGRSAGEPLLPAPRHQADFQRLGERIARSEEIRARLGGR